MGRLKRKRCRNCRRLFVPDHRNRNRQKYCDNPECRKASKAASQKKWLSKPENSSYFKGDENTQRVQEWRKNNPDYNKMHRRIRDISLQDPLNKKHLENTTDTYQFTNKALQDSLTTQPSVLIGLIAHLTGSVLQDNIAEFILRMQQSGQDILNLNNGGINDTKIPDFKKPRAQGP